jgi:hypothetical protein
LEHHKDRESSKLKAHNDARLLRRDTDIELDAILLGVDNTFRNIELYIVLTNSSFPWTRLSSFTTFFFVGAVSGMSEYDEADGATLTASCVLRTALTRVCERAKKVSWYHCNVGEWSSIVLYISFPSDISDY